MSKATAADDNELIENNGDEQGNMVMSVDPDNDVQMGRIHQLCETNMSYTTSITRTVPSIFTTESFIALENG